MDTTRHRIRRWQGGVQSGAVLDELAVEEPLEIQVDTRPVSVTMRTPGHDEELAAGFLLSEGLIHRATQIRRIQRHPRNASGNVLGVFLQPDVSVDFARLTRHVFASSSCGLCGKATIESVRRQFGRVRSGPTVRASVLSAMADRMRGSQRAFGKTGGLHAAGLFTAGGKLVVLREDVGRHNAVDKVLGYGLLEDHIPWSRHVLMVSGRASFEILQKALAARIAVVAAVSAPTSLAVEFARKSGQTLIGFLRGDQMNVYAGAGRVR